MRVVVVDDSALFREGLVRVLQGASGGPGDKCREPRSGSGPGEARPGTSGYSHAANYTDEGMFAAKRIRERHPSMGTLLLSNHVESHHAIDLLGQSPERIGYLLKDRVADIDEFLEAARRVASGGSTVDPLVVSQLLGRKRSRSLIDELTAREKSVLGLMAEGRSNDAIASALKISPKTLEAHIATIYSKLGLEPGGTEPRRVLAVLRYLGVS